MWRARLHPSGRTTEIKDSFHAAQADALRLAGGDTMATLMRASNGRPWTDEWSIRLPDGSRIADLDTENQ